MWTIFFLVQARLGTLVSTSCDERANEEKDAPSAVGVEVAKDYGGEILEPVLER